MTAHGGDGKETKLVEVIETHLPYEIGMLVFTAKLLETMQPGNLPENEAAVRNALIEIVLHPRPQPNRFSSGQEEGRPCEGRDR